MSVSNKRQPLHEPINNTVGSRGGSSGIDTGLKQNLAASFLSLITSGGTLLCCALPALLVSVGAGAAMAGLITNFPQLVWLSEHKLVLFTAAGLMLLMAGLLQWRARSLPCPADPALAATCRRARKISLWIYIFSVAIFAVGFFFAFIAPMLNLMGAIGEN